MKKLKHIAIDEHTTVTKLLIEAIQDYLVKIGKKRGVVVVG